MNIKSWGEEVSLFILVSFGVGAFGTFFILAEQRTEAGWARLRADLGGQEEAGGQPEYSQDLARMAGENCPGLSRVELEELRRVITSGGSEEGVHELQMWVQCVFFLDPIVFLLGGFSYWLSPWFDQVPGPLTIIVLSKFVGGPVCISIKYNRLLWSWDLVELEEDLVKTPPCSIFY